MSARRSGAPAPPRFATDMLERSLPDEMRDAISADMDEMFDRRAERSGVFAARMWYVLQALSFTMRFLWERLRPSSDTAQLYERERKVMTTGISWIDLKLGARMLVKYPSVSIIGGLALAGAIGLGAGMFEMIRATMSPSIPLEDGDRIVHVQAWNGASQSPEPRVMYDYKLWRDQLRSIEHLGASRTFERNVVTPDGRAQPVRIAEITASAFPLTGVQPRMGRALLESDEQVGAPPVTVLGYDVWQERFNGDPGILGKTIRLGRSDATVVGVMPEGFAFPHSQQAWVPLRITDAPARQGPAINVFGKLADGASLERAQVELDAISRRISLANPATHDKIAAEVRPYGHQRPSDRQSFMIIAIYLGTFMILLAACANVATLVFARTAMRESEIIVRNALGATRRRVMSQLFAESLVLTAVAAVVGLTVTNGIMKYLWHQATVVRQEPQAFWDDGSLEPSTVVFTVLLAVVGAVLVGLLPAIKATGSQVQSALQGARVGTSMKFGGVWSVIIILQVAFTVLCLPITIGATQEMYNDHEKRAQFPAEQYFTIRPELDRELGNAAALELSDAEYRTRMATVYEEFKRRVLAEPGVVAVTFADALPGMSHPMKVLEAQRGSEKPFIVDSNRDGNAHTSEVDLNFFQTFDIPLIAGRTFHAGDVGTVNGGVVINESLARNIGGNALGTRVRIAEQDNQPAGQWHTVVGVHKNLEMDPTGRGETDMIVIPTALADAFPATMAIKLNRTMAGFSPRLGEIAMQVDPGLRLYDPSTLSELIRRRDMPGIMAMMGASALAAMAIMLSAAGLYALMSVSVARRTREIGIRLALGSTRMGVIKSIFARSAAQIGTGILLGNLVVFGLVSYLSASLQFNVLQPMMGISLLMAVVGMAACALPARRVLRVQPTDAFKEAA